mmetsp:Transcript_11351/g.17154  ORF Transcript_11351/g.17154 Transcript_11351/m.17154 type:complete len:445 (-) Transcript_11351:71-1405(-)|eukprot:CAMPEP_0201523926 /NCGR_PEP_ID=MMETSP0161_2-20130828/21006_1 /ASSEMBLY_ACC=CAM_ASM_000251 /TAXON_ID=180227 /ORGANISM="Neoparamoeba aestuarina, Strain SoJaBio B1-5/56/2" /LENGTH=444 /DNA_ID=CAMNT_0047923163 /DNA_START=282 /DNA_END=1616 /DNA_ORIENTATION=+
MDKRAFYVVNTAGKKVDSKRVNIDGGDDPFYRYKVPQLQIQVVGKGKMIKTMLLNSEEVARALHLMPEYIPAYLGYDIGAQFKYETKKPERERAHISGEYTSLEISNVMAKMIKEVVLCPNCSLPELIMTCDPKKKTVHTKCDSCGKSQVFRKTNAKFLKYIGNNPPKLNIGVEAKNKKKGGPAAAQAAAEAEKKKVDAEMNGKGASPLRKSEDEEGDKPAQNGHAATKSPRDAEEQKGQVVEFDENDVKATEADLKRAEEEGVTWSTDISAEAMDSRRNELVPDSIKQMVVAGVDSSGIDKLKALLEKDPEDKEIISLLKSLRSSSSIDVDEAVDAVFSHVYDSGAGFIKATDAHIQLLKVLLNNETAQISFLTQLESIILDNPQLLKHTVKYLQKMYNDDLAVEGAILKWFSLGSEEGELNAMKTKAKRFVEWLETAEEESD